MQIQSSNGLIQSDSAKATSEFATLTARCDYTGLQETLIEIPEEKTSPNVRVSPGSHAKKSMGGVMESHSQHM